MSIVPRVAPTFEPLLTKRDAAKLLPAELEHLALPAAELAKVLGISERHLWAMHSSGRLGPRPVALGRAKRWALDEVRAWLAAGAPSRDKWLAMRSGQ